MNCLGKVDDEASIDTLLHASARWSVNFVDAAEYYGEGHSEEVIGEALRRWDGDKIYVATKVRPSSGRRPPKMTRECRAATPNGTSGATSKTPSCGSGWNHRTLPAPRLVPGGITTLDWLEVLNALRQEGKIDRIGCRSATTVRRTGSTSPDSASSTPCRSCLTCSSNAPVTSSSRQPPRVRRVHRPGAVRLRLAHREWTEDTYATSPEDSVPAWPFRGDRFGETLRRVAALKELCAPHFPTLAEAAMRFTLLPGRLDRDPRHADPGRGGHERRLL